MKAFQLTIVDAYSDDGKSRIYNHLNPNYTKITKIPKF